MTFACPHLWYTKLFYLLHPETWITKDIEELHAIEVLQLSLLLIAIYK